MTAARHPRDLPALLLYNVDPQWIRDDRVAAERDVESLVAGLRSRGYRVEPAAVTTSDLAATLAPYRPRDWVVLNWCEDLPGHRLGDVTAAAVLEPAGFTFTRASSQALALSSATPRVKRRLARAGVPSPAWRRIGAESTA